VVIMESKHIKSLNFLLNSPNHLLRGLRRFPRRTFNWLTATRLRKVLSSILAILIVLTSIRFAFFKPTEVHAADVFIKFDEGYGTTSAVNDTNGTVSAGSITNAVWRTEDLCKSGKCLFFDGTGDYVSFGDNANLDMAASDTVTIELWFRTSDITSGNRSLISKYETAGGDGGYRIYMNSSGQIVFGIDSNNTGFPEYSVTSASAYDDNKWHHVGAVKSGTSSMTLYINAQSVGTTSIVSTAADNGDSFFIGRFESDTAQDWLGFIDEVKVLRTARSATEVKADFTGETSSRGTSAYFNPDQDYISDGLVAYWKMEDSATPTTDSSGNGNSATWTGNATRAIGRFGFGTLLDGTGDYLSVSDSTSLSPTAELTVSAIASPSASIATKALVVKDTSYRMVTDGSGNPLCQIHDGTSWQTAAGSSVALSLLTWQTVNCVYNGSQTQVYVNGSLRGSSTVTVSISDNANALRIGSDAGGTYGDFNGNIDDIRIYRRAFSPSEIQNLYNWAPGPVGYWKLDEGTGTSAYDSSSNGNTATLTGSGINWTPGKFGSGLSFPGTNGSNYYDAGSGNSIDDIFDGGGTISGWFYIRGSGDSVIPYFFDKQSLGNGWYIGYSVSGNNARPFLNMQFSSADGEWRFNNYEMPLNSWNHLSVTYNNSSTSNDAVFYLNGTPVAVFEAFTPGGTRNSDSSLSLALGNNQSNGLNPAYAYFDDLRLYNYTRTTSQIVEDMNAGHPAGGSPVASPIIYWKLDDLQGNAKNSGSGGSSLDGTVSSVEWSPPDLACKINGCAFLSSGLDYISAGDPGFFDSLTQMTISLWLRSDSLATGKSIVSKTNLDAATQNTFNVATDSSNSDEIRVYIASSLSDLSNYFTTSNFDLTANTLTHLAVVYDGSLSAGERVKVYKNGVRMAGSVTGTINTSLTSSSSNLKMGDTDRSINTGLLGRYDEFKIYNFALSDPERLIDFNAGSATSLGGVLGLQNAEGLGTNTQRAGYWKMDENTGTTNVYDYSGLERTMTMTNFNSSDWVPGKFGTSLNFDGSSKYLNRASVVLTSQNSISFTAWVKPDNTNTGTIYMQGTTGANFPYRAINYESGAIRFRSTNDAGTVQDAVDASTGTLTVGAWNFIAVVKGSTTIAYYVNGIKSTTTVANSGTYANEAHSSIGVLRRSSNTQYFDGVVDEIQLFSKSVNDLEAAYLLDRAGPVLWYKLDECSGPTINNSAPISSGGDAGLDGTATANTGNNVGTCGGTAGDMWADGATGKWNASLAFDGTDDYVETADNDQLDFDDAVDFTLEAWINRDSFANDHTVIAKKTDQSNSTDGYIIYIDGTTDDVNFVASQAGGSTNTHTINGLTTITSSGWYHIVVVWDDDQPAGTTIYVNGKEDKESTSGSQSAVAGMINTNTFRLGSESDGGNEFDGRIDNVKIYRYAMPTSLIKRLYNEGSAQRFGPAEGSP